MIIKITCPKCETDGSVSIADTKYEGPYRCWKCKELFKIKLHNNELLSCEPMTEEELQKQQEIEELKKKISGE